MSNEVGRVSVRVIPDTRGFKAEANRQLRSLNDQLHKVKVKVIPDTDKFIKDLKKDLKKAGKKAQYKVRVVADMDKFKLPDRMPKQTTPMKVAAEVDLDREFQRKALTDLKKMAATFNQGVALTPDGEQLRRDMNKVFRDLEGKIRTDIPINPVMAAKARQNISRELHNLETYVTQGGNRKVNVPVAADTRQATRQIRQLIDSLPDMAKHGIGQVQIEMNKARAKGDLRQMIAELKAEAALASIEIDIDINTPLLRRASIALGSLGSALASVGKVAGTAGSAMLQVAGGVGTALAGLPKMLLLAVPLMLALIAAASLLMPVLALISGALVTLPGLVAGIAAPMAVVKLGMDGIKKAAETAKPAFEELKKTISGVFEKGMIPAFKVINDKLLPGMSKSMSLVATRMSEAFTAVVDTVSSDRGLGNLDKLFNNVAVGINKAIPGLKDFSEGILQLVGSISASFPNLGDFFSEMGGKFLDWVNEFTAIDPGTGLSQLDTMLSGLGDTLRELGGLGLDFITQGLKDMSNPSFAADMKNMVSAVREFATDVLPRLSQAFQDIVPWIEAFGQSMDVLALINRAGQDPFGTIKDGIEGLASGKSLAESLGIDTFNADAAKAGKEAGTALVAGVQAGAALGVGGAENQLASAGKALTDSITQQVAKAGGDTGVAKQIADQIGGSLAEAQAKVDAFGPALGQGITAATQPLLTLGSTIGGAFTAMNGMIIGMWSTTVSTLTSGAQQVVSGLSGAFANLPNTIIGPVSLMQAAATNGMAAVTAAFTAVGAEVSRVVTTSFGQLPAIVQTAMDGFNAALTNGGVMAIQTVSGWGAQIVSAVQSIVGAMQGSGASIGAAFAAGIRSSTGLVTAAASDLAAAARAVFPNSPAKEGPFSGTGWVDKSGEAVGVAFAKGLAVATPLVGSEASKMAQSVLDNLNNSMSLNIDVNLDPQFLADLKKEKDQLDLASKALGVQKDRAPDKAAKAALQAQLDQINARKREIGLIQEQADYQKKYGDQVSDTQSKYADTVNSMSRIPYDFAKTTADQFLGDIGISGNGALSTIANWGLDMGSKFVFNVGNMDQALSAQQNIQRKQAAVQYV